MNELYERLVKCQICTNQTSIISTGDYCNTLFQTPLFKRTHKKCYIFFKESDISKPVNHLVRREGVLETCMEWRHIHVYITTPEPVWNGDKYRLLDKNETGLR